MGSAMSHGAIIARELGVPCVTGTKTGTAQINTGDILDVNATSGTVTITDRGATALSRPAPTSPAWTE
jgi:phosphoenolpyruvate-protein kinase (PTS system EI component)